MLEAVEVRPLVCEAKVVIHRRHVDFEKAVNVALGEGWHVKQYATEVLHSVLGDEMRYIAFMERWRGSIDETAT